MTTSRASNSADAEMIMVPEVGNAPHTPGLETTDDKKLDSFDTEANSGDGLVAREAAPDTKASEIAEFHKQLPKLEYKAGVGGFFKSFGKRLRVALTPRLLLCILIGQTLSLAITTTSTVTTFLGMEGWASPAVQTFFVYAALLAVYTPLTLYKYGFPAWGKMVLSDGWKYAILASFDVFGNFVTVFAFQYSNLLHCLLINSWATPVSMLVCFVLLKSRYHWTQFLGVGICMAGLVTLVTTDVKTGKNWDGENMLKGDLFMLLGATLYGLSNGFQEFLVRGRPHYEVVGQLGFWGFIINGILVGGYEHATIHAQVWNGKVCGLLFGYIGAMFVLYTLAPILFRFSSAPFYNLNLMSSDFFSLLVGLAVFQYSPYWTYFIAFVLVIIGLITYNIKAPLESHAKTDVVARGKQAEIEAASGHARVIGAPKGKLGSIF